MSDDVVRFSTETFVRNGLDLEREVEVRKVLEGDRRHPDLVLLSWDLNDWGILIGLVEVLDADNLGHFAFGVDGETDRLQAFKLHLQEALNNIVLSDGRDLDCYFNLCAFFLADLEADFLEVLEALVAAYRKDVFVEVVELGIVAFGNHAQHVGI